jgi:hypothetical protein
MADNSVSIYKSKIEEMISNPTGMQRVCLNQLEAMMNGEIDIVDPSNPFVFLMETATLLSTVGIEQNAILNRKQYPSVAVSEDDIYLHMSDEDYIDRFAKPSSGKFFILLNQEEIKQKIDELPVSYPSTHPKAGQLVDRKVVIPKNTEITVGEHVFTMQYPIEIRKLSYGGLQIVYNNDVESPIYTLESNIVNWFSTRIEGTDFIAIEIKMQQIEITEYLTTLNISSGFVKTYLLKDKYYYTRAYVTDNNGNWVEIKTTHSDQIFDPTKITALIKVFSDNIRFEIPTIYFTNGLVSGKQLRLDVFTTKGKTDLILGSYIANQFTVKWNDYDNDDKGFYVAPIKNLKSLAVYSNDTISGGEDSITIDQLRDRVIENSVGRQSYPITQNQIVTTLNNLGFNVIKNLDNITDRQFLATREVPNAIDSLRGVTDASLLSSVLESSIATGIKMIQTTMDDLKNINTVYDNLKRITIASNTLFEDIDGIMYVVPNDQVAALNAMSKEAMVTLVNSKKYSYNPFHYVLDSNDNNFYLKPYYLDKPKALSKIFVGDNDKLSLEVSIDKYSIEKISTGYRLYLVTKSGTNFKNLYASNPANIEMQVSFKPYNSNSYVFSTATVKNAELIYGTGQTVVPKDELLFEVLLNTNYDIDSDENIYITNFHFGNTLVSQPCPLTVEMNFIICSKNNGGIVSSLDQWLDGYSPGSTDRAVLFEKINLELGRYLDYLWSNSRTIVSPEAYLKYTVDVPKIYKEDVYEIDPLTGLKKMTIVGNTITFNKLHSIGEQYVDDTNAPIFDHKAGDTVLDINGQPVPIDQRKVTRQLDLCLFDGKYNFVTETTNSLYKNHVPEIFVSWLENDLVNINSRLLERSVIYFYPKTTFGLSKIVVENGTVIDIYSEQSFNVKVYVPGNVYDNDDIKDSICKEIVNSISNALKNPVVSLTDVQVNIKTKLGNLIKGVEISGFGDNGSISTYTVFDDTIRMSIKKNLFLLSENNVSIKEDVVIDFIKHEL